MTAFCEQARPGPRRPLENGTSSKRKKAARSQKSFCKMKMLQNAALWEMLAEGPYLIRKALQAGVVRHGVGTPNKALRYRKVVDEDSNESEFSFREGDAVNLSLAVF